jgi:hypothetical protein
MDSILRWGEEMKIPYDRYRTQMIFGFILVILFITWLLSWSWQ